MVEPRNGCSRRYTFTLTCCCICLNSLGLVFFGTNCRAPSIFTGVLLWVGDPSDTHCTQNQNISRLSFRQEDYVNVRSDSCMLCVPAAYFSPLADCFRTTEQLGDVGQIQRLRYTRCCVQMYMHICNSIARQYRR